MGYMTRAMKARDPRYRRVLEKLGYGRRDQQAEPEKTETIADVRDEYERVLGKRPFNGWDADTLKRKIAEAGE